jgi:YegS/Rv2252/BmrU family lipid kinase
MERRFLFLLNPRAGVQKGQQLQQIIQQRCEAASVNYTIEHSRVDANYSQLREKISSEKITDIIIAGGDGTISAVTAQLKDLPINFGIIPRGSGNGLALAAGISRNPNKALDIIIKGNAQRVDGFFLNEHFSCMLSGLGFDAQVAHDFDNQKRRGFWKYVQIGLKNLIGIKTYSFAVQAKEKNLKLNAYFISIANSNQFGNYITIAPKASLTDGLLDVVAVEKTNFFLLPLQVLWHIRFGKFTKDFTKRSPIIYFQTDELTIENPQMAPLHIDGDGKETAKTISIKILPKAYSLLVP